MWVFGKTFNELKDKSKAGVILNLLKEMQISGAMALGSGANEIFTKNNFPFFVENCIDFGGAHSKESFERKIIKYWQGNNIRKDKLDWFIRTPCLSNPDYLSLAKKQIKEIAGKFKKYSPVWYDINDEPSITYYSMPGDFCFSEHCLAKFKKWLKDKYDSISKLNEEWNTKFSSFEEAVPLTVDEVREKNSKTGRVNFAPWSDHREFMDDVFSGFIAEMRKTIEEVDPDAPVGIEGGQAPAHCTGYDYWKLMKVCSFMEAYDIGNTLELTRSFNNGSVLCGGTYEPRENIGYFLWQRVLHGNNAAITWWSESCIDPKNLKVTEKGKLIAPYYKELTNGIVKKLREFEEDNDKIAIHYSQASIRSRWIQEVSQEPKEWLRGTTSESYSNMDFGKSRNGWCKVIEDLGMQYKFVSYEQVENEELIKAGYKVFIMPESESISDKEAAAVEDFVSKGGILIADAFTGRMNQHCRLLSKGLLDDVFETSVSKMKPGDFTTNLKISKYGEGKAVFLNFRLKDYPSLRQKSKESSDKYQNLMKKLISLGNISSRISVVNPVNNEKINGIEIFYFKNKDQKIYAVLRNIAFIQTGLRDIKIEGKESKTIPIKIIFPEKNFLYDLRKKKDVGETNSVITNLSMWEPKIYLSTNKK